MPIFVGGDDSPKQDRKATTVYAENSRNVEITTEGILEGLKAVVDAFEKNGVAEALKSTEFYHTSKKRV